MAVGIVSALIRGAAFPWGKLMAGSPIGAPTAGTAKG